MRLRRNYLAQTARRKVTQSMYDLDKSRINEVEHGIRPPMNAAITIPVDGIQGVSIYVVASPFTGQHVSDEELQRIANALEIR